MRNSVGIICICYTIGSARVLLFAPYLARQILP